MQGKNSIKEIVEYEAFPRKEQRGTQRRAGVYLSKPK
jgi:hypothetical protein